MSNLPTKTANYGLPIPAIGKIGVIAAIRIAFKLIDTELKSQSDRIAVLEA